MVIDVGVKQDAPERYLADGVYASFDGFQIWLRAPREDGDHVVALDPETFDLLRSYAQQIWGQS